MKKVTPKFKPNKPELVCPGHFQVNFKHEGAFAELGWILARKFNLTNHQLLEQCLEYTLINLDIENLFKLDEEYPEFKIKEFYRKALLERKRMSEERIQAAQSQLTELDQLLNQGEEK